MKIQYICDDKRHLICYPYSLNNLHLMAKDLEINKAWFHTDHYDIPKLRQKEISDKCEIFSSKDIVDIIKGKYISQKIDNINLEIIQELIYSIKTINQDLLASILEKYKTIPDIEILNLLREFNSEYDISYNPTEENEESFKPKLIRIKEDLYNVKFILSIKKDQYYSTRKSMLEHRIILNEDPTNKLMYSNSVFTFDSEEQRNKEFNILSKKLEQLGIIIL